MKYGFRAPPNIVDRKAGMGGYARKTHKNVSVLLTKNELYPLHRAQEDELSDNSQQSHSKQRTRTREIYGSLRPYSKVLVPCAQRDPNVLCEGVRPSSVLPRCQSFSTSPSSVGHTHATLLRETVSQALSASHSPLGCSDTQLRETNSQTSPTPVGHAVTHTSSLYRESVNAALSRGQSTGLMRHHVTEFTDELGEQQEAGHAGTQLVSQHRTANFEQAGLNNGAHVCSSTSLGDHSDSVHVPMAGADGSRGDSGRSEFDFELTPMGALVIPSPAPRYVPRSAAHAATAERAQSSPHWAASTAAISPRSQSSAWKQQHHSERGAHGSTVCAQPQPTGDACHAQHGSGVPAQQHYGSHSTWRSSVRAGAHSPTPTAFDADAHGCHHASPRRSGGRSTSGSEARTARGVHAQCAPPAPALRGFEEPRTPRVLAPAWSGGHYGSAHPGTKFSAKPRYVNAHTEAVPNRSPPDVEVDAEEEEGSASSASTSTTHFAVAQTAVKSEDDLQRPPSKDRLESARLHVSDSLHDPPISDEASQSSPNSPNAPTMHLRPSTATTAAASSGAHRPPTHPSDRPQSAAATVRFTPAAATATHSRPSASIPRRRPRGSRSATPKSRGEHASLASKGRTRPSTANNATSAPAPSDAERTRPSSTRDRGRESPVAACLPPRPSSSSSALFGGTRNTRDSTVTACLPPRPSSSSSALLAAGMAMATVPQSCFRPPARRSVSDKKHESHAGSPLLKDHHPATRTGFRPSTARSGGACRALQRNVNSAAADMSEYLHSRVSGVHYAGYDMDGSGSVAYRAAQVTARAGHALNVSPIGVARRRPTSAMPSHTLKPSLSPSSISDLERYNPSLAVPSPDLVDAEAHSAHLSPAIEHASEVVGALSKSFSTRKMGGRELSVQTEAPRVATQSVVVESAVPRSQSVEMTSTRNPLDVTLSPVPVSFDLDMVLSASDRRRATEGIASKNDESPLMVSRIRLRRPSSPFCSPCVDSPSGATSVRSLVPSPIQAKRSKSPGASSQRSSPRVELFAAWDTDADNWSSSDLMNRREDVSSAEVDGTPHLSNDI